MPWSRQMSSAISRWCGNSSLMFMPTRPARANCRLQPSSLASGRMNANRRPAVNDAGTVCPLSRLSVGLGSKSSRWLGPPHMNRKITDLALAGKWPGWARSGLADGGFWAAASRSSSEARAMLPKPTEQSRKKWRRERASRRYSEAEYVFISSGSEALQEFLHMRRNYLLQKVPAFVSSRRSPALEQKLGYVCARQLHCVEKGRAEAAIRISS